jgi:hypothetical protein
MAPPPLNNKDVLYAIALDEVCIYFACRSLCHLTVVLAYSIG